MQLDVDNVLAIHRETVPDDRAAARTERQLLAHALLLPEGLGHRVGLARRPHGARSDSLAADPARGKQVAFHQERRYRQYFGDVIEAFANIVGRQQRCDVGIDGEQVPDRVCVFRAIEAVDGRATRVWLRPGRLVEAGLQVGKKAVVEALVRVRNADRRHGRQRQLGNDALPQLRRSAYVGNVGRVEHHARGFQDGVVAGDAVLVQHRAIVGGRVFRIESRGRGGGHAERTEHNGNAENS